MSKNCLITTLKGSVANSKLPKFGEIELNAVTLPTIINNKQIQISIIIPHGEEYNIRVTDGGYFATSVENLEDPEKRMTTLPEGTVSTGASVSYFFKNDTYKIYLKGKYIINMLTISNSGSKRAHLINFDISNLKYCENLKRIDASGNIYFDGDVSAFAELKNLYAIAATFCNLYGNIINFGNMKISQDSSFGNNTFLDLGQTKINGTVESFVEKQVENGRTTTIPFRAFGLMSSEVTFGGHGKEDIPNANINHQTWLEWDYSNGRRKIILYYSSTSSSVATQPNDCDYIYVQGATAAEISAWETAGKTVIHWSDAS